MNNANGRIKTALEIAMERAQRIKISPEGLEKQRYIEEGKRLASKYLKSNDFDLGGVLNTYKGKAKNLCHKIGALFGSYERARKLLYERTKTEFEARIGGAKEALEGLGLRVEVENQPQFKANWSQVLGELDLKYEGMLKDYLELFVSKAR